uniref:Insulin-like 3 n=1 Tax=Catagonus wagneri TaxID=51154 RepID=A0A8C3YKI6_9CETA
MVPCPLTWVLVLLGPALALARAPAPAEEAPEKLCGHHFVRTMVRLCGGPRWAPEDGRPVAGGDRELLRWLEGQPLSHGLMVNGDPVLAFASWPLPQASRHHHHRRAAATNPAHHCCLSGCTRQDLLTLCPH